MENIDKIVRNKENLIPFIFAFLLILHLLLFIGGVKSNIEQNRYDFGAFYKASWRIVNDPIKLYWGGREDLPDKISEAIGYNAAYKYLPIFAMTLIPLTFLDYPLAKLVFLFLSLMAVILIALIVIKLFENFKWKIIGLVMVFLMPFPTIGSEPPWVNIMNPSSLIYYLSVGSPEFLSPVHFSNYREGNSKALALFLLTLSYYFAYKKNLNKSIITLALGTFDPRALLIALALSPLYWGKRLLKPLLYLLGIVALLNLPLLLIPELTKDFINMVFQYGIKTPLYMNSYLVIYTYPFIVIAHYIAKRESMLLKR
ncbi:MAG: hypothetical protein QXX95_06720 [Nitrososphaerales archaeon]